MTVQLPERAQVVIIGGGILGCSVAYHLAKAGRRSVVLLERQKLTSGTTWHAAGLVGQVQGSQTTTCFAKYSSELFQELENETGQSTGFRATGSLAVATQRERMMELRRKSDYAQCMAVKSYEVSLEEIAERWPLLNMEGVVGGTYQPGDGWANPTDVTMALAKGARMHGAKILESTRVEKAVIESGRVTGVATSGGIISTECVVNCAGMWARELGRQNGVHIPNQACEHYYLVSEVISGLPKGLPVLRIHDERTYYKEDAGKLLFGFMHGNAKPWGLNGIPESFCFDSLPFVEEDVMRELEMAVNRVPVLGKVGIRTFFNGPESFTMDGHFILGEAPDVKGYYILAGMNSTGIQTGGGAGRALAQWIIDGYPPMDLSEMDPKRLESFQAQDLYLRKRSAETLVRTYAMHWPNYHRTSVRGLRRTPLHAAIQTRGAFFGESLGWERAEWYAPSGNKPECQYSYSRQNWFPYAAGEHKAVREGVGLIDMGSLGKLRIEGPDAQSVMQRICTADSAVAPGRVFYSLWLNERGGIESDVTVARLRDDCYFVMGSTDNLPRDRVWLRDKIPPDARVTLRDETTAYGALSVAGPKSRELLSRVTDLDLSNESFPFATTKEFYLGHARVRGQRISYTGELGWELFFSPDFGTYILELILEAGSDLGVRLVGTESVNSLRLEKGYRHWGHDISYTDSPFEVGLSFACNISKNLSFIGRDAYLSRKERPPSHRLCSILLLDPEPLLYHDEPIYRNGMVVGRVTSGSYGHTLGGAVGLGLVDMPGDKSKLEEHDYAVRIDGKPFPAKVSLRSFYDPNRERLRT